MTEELQQSLELADVSSDLFGPAVGAEFKLVSGEVSMPVRLADCKENPDAMGPDTTRTPFLLLFQADEDNNHPMQQAKEFHGAIEGLEKGTLSGLLITRTLRPMKMPAGAYYQVIFG
ncbi:hypothetical protein [Kordiimonas sp.]|uniref:hypothetical protein n=1 Tax=Kordiimonas sp. TaxID=1970157 RepID=UPI003A90F055